MKKYKLCITFCMSFILLSACSKEEPLMIGDFYYKGVAITNLSFTILDANEKYIILLGERGRSSVLKKDGEKITGRLYHDRFNSLVDVDVTGTYKKWGKHYRIRGIFTANHTVHSGPHTYEYIPVSGTFLLR